MDRDDASFTAETTAVERSGDCAFQAEISMATSRLSALDAILIATSWAALVSFVVYPQLQVIAFGVTVVGVAILSRAGKGL